LSPEQRATAVEINRVIVEAAAKVKAGAAVGEVEKTGAAALEKAGFKVDYVAVRDVDTLGPWDSKMGHAPRVLAAAWLGKTRLIDNV
ncbi:MAG: pantoate--beta-alanine ligase, partial [Hyphomicrobiaceae bacterium]